MNKGTTRFLLFFTLMTMAFTGATYAQEICDNGSDDDGDGLIDLRDPDCDCYGFTSFVNSVLPNPSFEQNSACPDFFSQMDRVSNWDNASSSPFSSTDYIHTCGFMTEDFITPPTPFPDGDACIGLMSYNRNSTIHEYVGTCLPGDPLEEDTSYTLNFYVGFGIQTNVDPSFSLDSVYSESPAYFTLYGNSDCSQFPFPTSTCPTDYFSSKWEPIDTIEVFGNEEWVKVELKFTPQEDYQAIVLGAPCGSKNLGNELQYHFIDNLILSKTANFTVQAPIRSGSVCDSSLVLSSATIRADIDYQWYKDSIAIPGANSPTLNLGGGNIDGNYQVRISKDTECQVSLPLYVSSSSDNNLTINGPRGICPGDNAMLSSTAGFDSYLWSTGDSTESITVSDGGVYSLTVSDGNGCNFETNFDLFGPVMIDAQAIINDAQGTNDNGSITLNPTGGIDPYTFQWSTGSDQSSINNLSEGRYYVTIADDIGCAHIDSFDIEFIPNEFEFKFEIKNLDCHNDSSGRLKVEMSGGIPPFTVLWNTGSTEEEIRNLAAGKYSVTITDNLGEERTYETFLSEPKPLIVSDVQLSSPSCNGYTDGRIEATIFGGTPSYQYEWTGKTEIGPTLGNIPAGSYQLRVSDDNNCILNTEFILNEPEPIVPELEYEAPSCFGYEDGHIRIFNIQGGTGEYSVKLNDETIPLRGLDGLEAGTYSLEIRDQNLCLFDQEIILETPPEVRITAIADNESILKGDEVALDGIVQPDGLTDYTISWEASTFDPQLECDRCLHTMSRPASPTNFTLTINKNGCTFKDEVFVDVSSTTFYAPNAFSPNGDGINDRFTFASNFDEGLYIKELTIFDRWGSLIHQVQDIDIAAYPGWDGRKNGELLRPGVYIYQLILENGRGERFQYAGDIMLKD